MKPCVVIPVYNHGGTVGDVVKRSLAVAGPDVLVVDDGSTDGGGQRAEAAGAEVLALDGNRGKGAAIVAGLKWASKRGYTHGIVVDADGQHLPEEIPKLRREACRDEDKIWIGVRRMDPDATPAASRRGRAISNFWTTLNGWQRCLDAQSGFRVYPAKEVLALGCKEQGFTFEMEVLVRAAWAGIGVGHVEVEVVYPSSGRVSHFKAGRDNLGFSWLSFRFFFGMVLRSPLLLSRKLTWSS